MMQVKKNRGFTLIELIAVVAILLIISFLSIPAWLSFSDTVSLEDAAKLVETKIKLAKNYSLNSLNNSNYGIHFDTNAITLYTVCTAGVCGTYNAAEPTNQIFDLPNGLEIYAITLDGGGSDLVFDRLTGTTDNDGTVGIRIAARPSKTKQIYINKHGQTGIGAAPVSLTTTKLEDPTNGSNARHIHFNLSGWSIQSSPLNATNLIFKDGSDTIADNILTSSHFNADGVFDWQGTVTVDSVAQKLRIHTLDANGTTLCIMRDRMQNSKSIKISFIYSASEKKVVTYTEDAINGTVTVTPDSFDISSWNPQ